MSFFVAIFFLAEPSYELAAYAMELHRSYLMDSVGKPAVEDVFRNYELALDEMSSRIARSLTTYDLYSMSLAIIILTLVCLLFVCFDLRLLILLIK